MGAAVASDGAAQAAPGPTRPRVVRDPQRAGAAAASGGVPAVRDTVGAGTDAAFPGPDHPSADSAMSVPPDQALWRCSRRGPTARITIVGGKFAVAAVWCVTLGLHTYLVGLVVGAALGLPGWSVAVAVTGLLRVRPYHVHGFQHEDWDHTVSLLLVLGVRRICGDRALPPLRLLVPSDLTGRHVLAHGPVLERHARVGRDVEVPDRVTREAAFRGHGRVPPLVLHAHQRDLANLATLRAARRENDDGQARVPERRPLRAA